MASNAKAHRRSLKNCLKSVLLRRTVETVEHSSSNLTIEGKEQTLALLPAFSSLSTLSNFTSSRFDLDQESIPGIYQDSGIAKHLFQPCEAWLESSTEPESKSSFSEIYDAYRYQSELGELATTCSIERDWYANQRFRERSLSQVRETVQPNGQPNRPTKDAIRTRGVAGRLVTPESIHFGSPLSRIAQACNVPHIYQHGASQQASLATLRSQLQSTSTLRLQRSKPDLHPIPEVGCGTSTCHSLSPSPDRVTERTYLIDCTVPLHQLPSKASRDHVLQQNDLRTQRAAQLGGTQCTSFDFGFASIDHFRSFCVLDAATPGCPVTAISEDLLQVFEIGEEFCLNSVGVDGATMDTVTGVDSAGNAIVQLLMYTPLINPNSGRSRFVLATLLDITSFITETASVPRLDLVSKESLVEPQLQTPPSDRTKYPIGHERIKPGCVDAYHYSDPGGPIVPIARDDVWLDIASEESHRSRSITSAPSTPRSSSITTLSSGNSIADVLDQFISALQDLYSEFFLLGKSPLDEDSYEICNVSPKVYESREYIDGHLSKTSRADKVSLESRLSQNKCFCMEVRWGSVGQLKQLYCIPLFGRSNVTWVCFLVEAGRFTGLPLWD